MLIPDLCWQLSYTLRDKSKPALSVVVDLVGSCPYKTACPGSGITAPYRIAFYGATYQCSKIGICSGAAADTCPLSVGSSPAAGISRKAKNRNTWLANMLAGRFFVEKRGEPDE